LPLQEVAEDLGDTLGGLLDRGRGVREVIGGAEVLADAVVEPTAGGELLIPREPLLLGPRLEGALLYRLQPSGLDVVEHPHLGLGRDAVDGIADLADAVLKHAGAEGSGDGDAGAVDDRRVVDAYLGPEGPRHVLVTERGDVVGGLEGVVGRETLGADGAFSGRDALAFRGETFRALLPALAGCDEVAGKAGLQAAVEGADGPAEGES
jgi:hypothetical protein